MKTKWFDFNYPIKYISLSWDWPWQSLGSWWYKKWEHKSHKTIWKGRRILGFKKIIVSWDCGPLEACLLHSSQKKDFENLLLDMCRDPEKYFE